MFCPKCSQQQVSDETRFCSRCGFQLGVVKALLNNDEVSQGQNAEMSAPDRSLRKRDMTIGAALMFFFALFVAVITFDLPPPHSARIGFLIVAWFALSLLINIKPIIRYFFHGDAQSAANRASASELAFNPPFRFDNNVQNAALPSAQNIPAADLVMPRRNTMEIVAPPSVAETTTNLLENK
jgi:hypothetical protein